VTSSWSFILQPPAQNLVTVLTELPRILIHLINFYNFREKKNSVMALRKTSWNFVSVLQKA